MGDSVEFERKGETIDGYLALPEGDGPFPGLVVVPDVHGLSDHYRDIAGRFAAEGFATLAINLYSREGKPTLGSPDEVFRWIQNLPDPRVVGDLQAAVDYLGARPQVRAAAIGITGYCVGGQYAIMAACQVRGLAACVSWYGMVRYAKNNDRKPASPLQLAANLSCPYLGMFGADDMLIPQTDVEELRTTLQGASKTFEIEVYEGAGHAFFNDTRPEMYRPAVAKQAWPRAVKFLRKNLAAG
jgi:carboxymethylenebutenolidase